MNFQFKIALPCVIILAVTLANPTTFEAYLRQHKQPDDVPSDDYGWYAPIAMLLAPLPVNSGRVRNRIKPYYGYRAPSQFVSPSPDSHHSRSILPYHQGISDRYQVFN